VVVGLDLHGDSPALAHVDHAGVLLTGLDQHLGAILGQLAQQLARALVTAVLAPHRAEQRQLQLVRLATEQFQDALVLGWRNHTLARRRGRGQGEGALNGGDH